MDPYAGVNILHLARFIYRTRLQRPFFQAPEELPESGVRLNFELIHPSSNFHHVSEYPSTTLDR